MSVIRVSGHIDEQHRLFADVPDLVPPGPVTVLIVHGEEEDEAGQAWMNGISQQWSNELSDVRQDIYTLEDGEPSGVS